jgi:two-component sensor histidine kinase
MSDSTTQDAKAAAEARHKLANVFQLLSTLTRMRIQRSDDEEAKRQLTWILDAVSALALLHNRSPGPDGADFSRYLRELAPLWRRRCNGRPIEIDMDLQPLAVPERHESALALITHELVLNAITHGFPDSAGTIRVAFGPGEGGMGVLSVHDDGCGYDPQTVFRGRLGLWLIGGLAGQIQGALTTTCEAGVRVQLVFPVPAEG